MKPNQDSAQQSGGAVSGFIPVCDALISSYGANTMYWLNAGSMLGQCLRRWPNIEPALSRYVVFAEIVNKTLIKETETDFTFTY